MTTHYMEIMRKTLLWRISLLFRDVPAGELDKSIRHWVRGTVSETRTPAFLVVLDGGLILLHGITSSGQPSSVSDAADHAWSWQDIESIGFWGVGRFMTAPVHPKLHLPEGKDWISFGLGSGQGVGFIPESEPNMAHSNVLYAAQVTAEILKLQDDYGVVQQRIQAEAAQLLGAPLSQQCEIMPLMMQTAAGPEHAFLAVDRGRLALVPAWFLEGEIGDGVPATTALEDIRRFEMHVPSDCLRVPALRCVHIDHEITDIKVLLELHDGQWVLWIPLTEAEGAATSFAVVDSLLELLVTESRRRAAQGMDGPFLV